MEIQAIPPFDIVGDVRCVGPRWKRWRRSFEFYCCKRRYFGRAEKSFVAAHCWHGCRPTRFVRGFVRPRSTWWQCRGRGKRLRCCHEDTGCSLLSKAQHSVRETRLPSNEAGKQKDSGPIRFPVETSSRKL